MIELVLDRIITGKEGTFGVLSHDGKPFVITLEREWLNNRRRVSCIPSGNYICLRCSSAPEYGFSDSPKFGDTFTVTNVTGRQFILFHKGNIDEDSHGCIIIGEQFGRLRGSTAVLASGHGFDEFMDLLNEVDQFKLTILDHFI